MKPYYIEGDAKTPRVLFEPATGLLEISGRSIPDDSFRFYQPLIDWVGLYSESPGSSTTLNVQLEHFNTGSARCLLELLKKLVIVKINGSEIVINWYYEKEDEDMIEACQAYESVIDIPFNKIAKAK
jgi:hypothetical protein